MRTETSGNIKVTLFDEVAYDREKNLVVVERLTSTPTWVDVDWGGNINTVRYYFDQTDKITIDWSDIIRTASGGEVNIEAETSEVFSFEYTVKHGVMPKGTIAPPQVIWQSPNQKIELIHTNGVAVDALISGVWTEVIPKSVRSEERRVGKEC